MRRKIGGNSGPLEWMKLGKNTFIHEIELATTKLYRSIGNVFKIATISVLVTAFDHCLLV